MTNVRGLTYQTLIEITGAIESAELRRVQPGTEHPRASSTDDVEGFFSLCRRLISQRFTLREFKDQWPRIVK